MLDVKSLGVVVTNYEYSVLRVVVSINGYPYENDYLYFPFRVLNSIIVRSLLSPQNASIVGPVGVAYVVQDLKELGYVGDVHFHETSVHVYKGLRLQKTATSLFFKECPVTLLTPHNLRILIKEDSICMLSNYSGPSRLDSLLDGLSEESSDFEIASRLLACCDTVVLPLDDGEVFGAYIKMDTLELTSY